MESERKWMVNGWPEGLPLKEEFAMRQGRSNRKMYCQEH